MMRSLFAAISGLRSHQLMLDVTANNIANVNTVGYKSERTSFKDALSELQQGAGAPTAGGLGGTNAKQVGLGVQVGAIDNVMTSGATQSTGSPFDLAIQGEGWFTLNDKADMSGAFYYTRSGNFTRDMNGNLVTSEGYYLVARDAGNANVPVVIPVDATSYSIGPNGTVTVTGTTPATADRTIALAKFPNQAGLVRASGTRYSESANSGVAALGAPGAAGYGTISAGTIEMSNVDLSQEFTNMITAQRGFQANGRVISTADDILQELVNLKR